MADNQWDWVEAQDKVNKEKRSKDYFNIEEGANRFVLLTHFARFAQVFDPGTKKYRPAEDGDAPESITPRGVCWVYQDGLVKLARFPYTVVKAVRALANDPEWDFEYPFPHVVTLNAEGAGTKEVKYSVTPSPKIVPIPAEILAELAKKPSPEDMVEKMKEKAGVVAGHGASASTGGFEYPKEDVNPEDIPF